MEKWECFVCWKVNEVDAVVDDAKCVCQCCGRPRNFVPRSAMVKSCAKPLLLHGLATAQHELHPALIQGLQEAGLDLAVTDSAGWTALHCAAMLGDATAVQCLLNSHERSLEDANHTDKQSTLLEAARAGGWRALHLATRGGHLKTVEELLLADADVNARLDPSDDALTPLHIAAREGHSVILDLLLQCGADPTLLTQHLKRSPLHIAVAAGHEQCVRLLLATPTLFSIRDGDGLTAIQLANLLPPSGRNSSPVQREIPILLEAHQPFGSTPPTHMKSLLD